MTSIAGCVFTTEPIASRNVCDSMMKALPDFGGLARRLCQLDDAAFGCNLSERLPEDRFDRQPLRAADRYLMVADVRIDNRDELIAALYGPADQANELADIDILLRAWAEWQGMSLELITGDFAFAVYDHERRRLTLARDPTGQCPLFYAHGDGFAAFASMPSGLLASTLIPNDFDLDWLAKKLLGFTDIGEDTSFAHVKRIAPGHVITIIDGSIERRRYWRPRTTPLTLSNDAFVEAYDLLFSRAVKSNLRRRGGAVAVHLSSGFDSSAVAAFTAELSPIPPLAFTSAPRAGFDGPVPRGRIADESSLAAKTAQMYGMSHEVVRSTGHPLASLRKDARIYQEPDRNIVNMDWWGEILDSARKQGVTILLTGTLGNLTVHAGGLPILAQWMTTDGWRSWWREARASKRLPTVRWRGILFNSFGSRLPRLVVHTLDRVFRGAAKAQDTNFLHAIWRNRAPALARAERALFASGDYNADRLAAIASQDPGLFRLGALVETGVDERDPTADRRLMEFSFRLPPHQMLKDGVSRPLMRRALANRLPEAILNNPSRGLQGADWYEQIRKEEVFGILDDVSRSKTVNQLIDLEQMRRTLDQWPDSHWSDPSVTAVYRRAFTLTLSTAVFIDEFERMIKARDFRGCFSSGTSA